MEELQKTQEYAGNIERRRMQQPYTGEDRRKRAPWTGPVGGSGEHLVAEGREGHEGEPHDFQHRVAWPFDEQNRKDPPQ